MGPGYGTMVLYWTVVLEVSCTPVTLLCRARSTGESRGPDERSPTEARLMCVQVSGRR